MAYVPLPIIEVDLDDLHLDLENYRIPTRSSDEPAALRFLFASEQVADAALLILRDRYFDNEVPIVTADGKGYVVLEGNRRVSALKALHDPGIVPSHTTEIQALLKRYATEAEDLPVRIRVLVAPSREEARPRVARLHTGASKKPWSRDQQATFYYSLLDETTTVSDIKRAYSGVEVARFMRMAVVRRFLVGATFADKSLHEYVSSSALTMSAFEYAYRRDDIADAIGVHFDKDGLLLPTGKAPEEIAAALTRDQRSALEYLVEGFRANHWNTRSAEFREGTDEHRELVARLRGEEAPSGNDAAGSTFPTPEPDTDDDSGGPASSDEGSGGSLQGTSEPVGGSSMPDGADAEDSANSTSRGPNHPDTKARLNLAGVDFTGAPVNLQRRYFELQRIKVTDMPVTTAILLRSILEMTIKLHFDSTPTPVSGMLSDALDVVLATYGKEKALKNTISTIRSGKADRPGSVQWFNMASHDANALISAVHVRQAWEQINPLLRRLLQPA
jgi:hypothetical protein